MATIVHENIYNTEDFPFKIFDFHAHNLNRVIPFHWHQSTEILFCAKGKLIVNLKGQEHLLKAGDYIAINPYEIHSTQSPMENWILCIQLPFKYMSQLTFNRFFYEYRFKINSTNPDFQSDEQLNYFFKTILKRFNKEQSNFVDRMTILTLVTNVITILTDKYSEKVEKAQKIKNINFIEEVTDYLSRNSSQDVKLKSVAEHFAYSESYTSRLIKSSLGTNYSEMLKIIRINKAVDLLNTSSLNLNQIAEETGFKTYRNLYNAFYQIYQMSPKEFKLTERKKTS